MGPTSYTYLFVRIWLISQVIFYQVEAECTEATKTATTALTARYELQTLRSPGWEQNAYLTTMDCKWVINSGDPSSKVLLVIEEYYIEADPSCSYDSLKIHDGSSTSAAILATLCGNRNSPLTYTSAGQYITLAMKSDFSVQYKGFSSQYSTGNDQSGTGCTATQDINATSPNLGYLSSPGFPSALSSSSACSWRIKPSNSNNNITLQILFSDVAATSSCTTDSLKIYEGNDDTGNLLASFCDSRQTFPSGQTVFIAYQSAFVVFDSQSSNVHGFYLSYNETESGVTTPTPPTTPTTTPTPVTACGTTTLSASDTVQYFTSQSYPVFYTNNLDCTWLIQAPTGYDILLTFIDFSLEESDDCVADKVVIYDGDTTEFPVLGTFCGETFSDVNSTSNSLLIKFQTDQSYTARGFHISYLAAEHDTPSCVDSDVTTIDLNASSTVQYFTSINFPDNYNSSSTTQWLIYNPTESDDIIVTVVDSRVEASRNCIYDKVTVYKGPCTSYPILGSFCGVSKPTYYQTAGKYVLVVFTTDVNVEFKGFYISYVLGEAPTSFPVGLIIGLIIGPILGIIFLIGVIFCIIMAYRKYKNKHKFTRIRDGEFDAETPTPGPSSTEGTATIVLPPLPDTTAKLPPIDTNLLYKIKLPPISKKKK